MVVNSANTAENTGKATNLKRKRPEEEVYVKQEPQEDDVPAGNETEDESEGKEERDDRTSDNNGLLTVKIDPAVLNCTSCHKHSQSSLFQCINGHAACSRCCAKLKNKCNVCSLGTGFIRCLALESVVKSIEVLCRNSNFGCNDVVSYAERDNHEKACIHNPCYCPMPDCTFRGTSSKLSTHFTSKHRSSLCYIRYGRFMTVHIKRDQLFCVLNARDGHLFLILNSRDVPSGNSLSFACIRQRSKVWHLEYELKVMGGKGNTLYLKGPPMDMTRWDGEYPAKFFLFVPGEHLESQTPMKIEVKIQKIKPVEVE